jgi:hypothetical protein
MKTITIALLLLALGLRAGAQLATNQPSQYQCEIAWSEKETGTGGNTLNPTPDAVSPGNSGEETCTSPGHEMDLKWTFLGRDHDQDAYEITFTRMIHAGSALPTTSSKDVLFNGKRMVVFDDALHLVVIESPSDDDSKRGQNAR